MINLSCYLTDQTSYGLVSLNILRELCKSCEGVSLFPIGQAGEVTERHYHLSVGQSLKNSEAFNPAIPSLRIDHQFKMYNSVGYGQRYGFTFFEMNQFTKKEKYSLNSLDRLIVSSKWAKNICDNSLTTNTSLVPLGVDRSIFSPQDYKPDKCIFLSIGKWEIRKDQDGIVKAFNDAFTNKDNVELWLLYESHHVSRKTLDEKAKEYTGSKLGDKIKLLKRVPNQASIARLMQQSYCFVSNSKAEAWNMELLEAMSCGKYCISPAYSGETEYINNENTIITDHGPLEPAKSKWFGNESTGVNIGEWCTPIHEALVANMMYVYKLFDSDKEYLNQAGLKTSREFSWENTVRELKKVL